MRISARPAAVNCKPISHETAATKLPKAALKKKACLSRPPPTSHVCSGTICRAAENLFANPAQGMHHMFPLPVALIRRVRCPDVFLSTTLVALMFGSTAAAAEPGTPAAQRSPEQKRAFEVQNTATGGAIVRLYDEPIAEYIVDCGNKPFLWRIIGPTGKSMTRSFPMADVPGETTDHVHQRGLTFGHQSVNGFDTWAEEATYRQSRQAPHLEKLGRIRHRGYRLLAGGPQAVIHANNEIVDAANSPLLDEERRMTFSFGPGSHMIDVDIDLIAVHGPVDLADMKDAGVYIRVPDSMTVDRGMGGTIINSNGERDAAAWSRHASWVDYHGPVDGEHLGIAILNHPTSFRHPTAWHVRTYGLFCANPFGLKQMNPSAQSGAVTLGAGEKLSLRHRFIFHVGDEQQAGIAAAYEAYAAETPPPLNQVTGSK
jgi:hypothetical protein